MCELGPVLWCIARLALTSRAVGIAEILLVKALASYQSGRKCQVEPPGQPGFCSSLQEFGFQLADPSGLGDGAHGQSCPNSRVRCRSALWVLVTCALGVMRYLGIVGLGAPRPEEPLPGAIGWPCGPGPEAGAAPTNHRAEGAEGARKQKALALPQGK